MSPKIKICGVCDPLEARRIEELGADYVGMIFYSRSPRFVDIGKAKKIAGAMSGRAKRVGVFVSESQDFIKTAAAECGLAAIQLHGGQSADFAEEIAETGCEPYGLIPKPRSQRPRLSRARRSLRTRAQRLRLEGPASFPTGLWQKNSPRKGGSFSRGEFLLKTRRRQSEPFSRGRLIQTAQSRFLREKKI